MALCDTVSDLKTLWQLDSGFTFLNHGSFGAAPIQILLEQYKLQLHIDRQPVRFFQRELDCMLDSSRKALSKFLAADPAGLAFVPNATTGVNAVLRSLHFDKGDEILTTDHTYNACQNAVNFVAERYGAKARVVQVPFKDITPDKVRDIVLGAVSKNTRLLLIDHITSPTALIFPIKDIVDQLKGSKVRVLVDGAHAPGMIPLQLDSIGAHYYTGNCHKWLCCPKGSAFLYVREDLRQEIRPVTISHGANSRRTHKSIFLQEFDWTGTDDYTPFIMAEKAIQFLGSLYNGGISELMAKNHSMIMEAGKTLAKKAGITWDVPEEMIGSMASLPILPLETKSAPADRWFDPIQDSLYHRFGVEVPVIPWPSAGRRLVRISGQAYNTMADFEKLADCLEVLR